MPDIVLTKRIADPKIQSTYEDPQFVRSYDADRYGGDFGSYLHAQEVEAFSSMVSAGNRLLDLGSGTGKLALALATGFETVVCADSSFEMLSVLKRKAMDRDVDIVCVVTDAQQLCFRRGAFDCLVSSRVLMHLADWKSGVSELSRVSREVVIDFPPLLSLAGLGLLLRGVMARFRAVSPRPRAISSPVLRQELLRHSRVPREWMKAYFFPIALHRRLNRSALTRRIEEPFRRIGFTRLFGAPVTLRANPDID